VLSVSHYSFGQGKVDKAWETWERGYKSYVIHEGNIFFKKMMLLSAWRNGSVHSTLYYYQGFTDSDDILDELKIDPSIAYQMAKAPFDDITFKNMTSKLNSMQNLEDPYFDKMSKKEQNEYLELWKKRISHHDITLERIIENQYLTDAQRKKGQEIQIMFMRHFPLFITPRMFNALDLSQEQKLKLDQICQKLEPEYKEYINRLIDYDLSWEAKLADKIAKNKFQKNKEFFEVQKTHAKEQYDSDEWQKLLQQKNLLITKLEKEVSQILTDKQLQRMNELINNPLDSVKKCIKVLNERNVKSP
jgi:hypothetical protein